MITYRVVATTLLINAALLLAACDTVEKPQQKAQPEVARPAKIVPVISTGISSLRTYPGTLEASQKAELAFRVGGQLLSLPAQPGLRVKKGDLLAQLDDADYRNTYNERKARYELAKIQHNQASKLIKQKLSSQLQFDQAVAELRSAEAALEQARDNLQYTRLVAPFDGMIARVDVENFQAIQAKMPIIQLHDERGLEVHFSVPESLISQLKRVEDPEIINSYCGTARISSHPDRPYKACHKEHESVPDPLTRNYAAVFSLEQTTNFALLPGMSVSIELDFTPLMPESERKWLLVPLEAVYEKDGKQWVWRVNDQMRAVATTVQVGHFEGEMLEIIQGLTKSDRVIAAGVSYVREGMLVKPFVKERGL